MNKEQVACPECGSYKTISHRGLTAIIGVLFIFPLSLVMAIFLGVIGFGLMVIIGILMIGSALFPSKMRGYKYMCYSCNYQFLRIRTK